MTKDSEKKTIEHETVLPEGDVVAPRIPTERLDLKILQALRRIMRGVDIHSKKLVGTHDITAPQLICLITVAQDGPLTLKALAEKVFLSPSTVVGILDRLEGKGLVLRARDTRDRRLVNVTATATGKGLVEHAPSPLQEGLARALKELPEIEQATIALSLQRIVDLMEVEALDAAPMLDTGASLANGTLSGPDTKNNEDEQET
jgi:DNA-binding MarR family transcriptional regulator